MRLENVGLQLHQKITLQDDLLHIRHGLKNLSNETRRIALWSISSFAPHGDFFAPWEGTVENERRPLLFPGYQLKAGIVDASPCGLLFRPGATTQAYKVGVRSSCGVSEAHQYGRKIVSHVAFDAAAQYPEDGANIAFYRGVLPDADGWAETEQMGPLTKVESGKIVWMQETLRTF